MCPTFTRTYHLILLSWSTLNHYIPSLTVSLRSVLIQSKPSIFLSGFHTQISHTFLSSSPKCSAFPTHLILTDIKLLNNRHILFVFFHSPISSSFQSPNIFFDTSFSNTFNMFFPINCAIINNFLIINNCIRVLPLNVCSKTIRFDLRVLFSPQIETRWRLQWVRTATS